MGMNLARQDFQWGLVEGGTASLEPKISFFLEILGVAGSVAMLGGLAITRWAPIAANV